MPRLYNRIPDVVCEFCQKTFHPGKRTTTHCSLECLKAGHLEQAKARIVKGTKTCSHCKTERPIADFAKNTRANDGLTSWCRQCYAARDRTVWIEYQCEVCGKQLTRNTPRHGKKVFPQILCSQCVRKAIIAAHGGRPANWTGTRFFPGKHIAAWKHSARRRNHGWHLTPEDLDQKFLLQGGACALSGISMILEKGSPYRPSIDRIDSSLGYVIGNFQFVCSVVNIMKNKLPEPLFLSLCSSISRFREESHALVGIEDDADDLIR